MPVTLGSSATRTAFAWTGDDQQNQVRRWTDVANVDSGLRCDLEHVSSVTGQDVAMTGGLEGQTWPCFELGRSRDRVRAFLEGVATGCVVRNLNHCEYLFFG